MIVLDASAWVRAVVDAGPSGGACRHVLTEDLDWAAPGHAPIEALRTIRRYELVGLLSSEEAGAHARSVRAAEVRFVGPEGWILQEVWNLRHNISPDDAPYVALALGFDAPLVTTDGRLGRAAARLGARVVVPEAG